MSVGARKFHALERVTLTSVLINKHTNSNGIRFSFNFLLWFMIWTTPIGIAFSLYYFKSTTYITIYTPLERILKSNGLLY